MRILFKDGDHGAAHICVTEIITLRHQDTKTSEGFVAGGLQFLCRDGEWKYIPAVSKNICESVCAKLLQFGWCDLTRYGCARTVAAKKSDVPKMDVSVSRKKRITKGKMVMEKIRVMQIIR